MNYTKKIKTAFLILKQKGIRGIIDRIYEKYIRRTRTYDFYKTLNPGKYKKELAIWFKVHTGQELNWKHPTGFNQKIQYLKLYDSTPLRGCPACFLILKGVVISSHETNRFS